MSSNGLPEQAPLDQTLTEEKYLQWRKATVRGLAANKIQNAAIGMMQQQMQQEVEDQFPQVPEEQARWAADTLAPQTPLPMDRLERRAQTASGATQQAILEHIARMKAARSIWDWFHKRGEQRGQLDASVLGMGWAEHVGGAATFQRTGIDALYDEVKRFTQTGNVSLRPPGFEQGLIEKGKSLLRENAPGWMKMSGRLQAEESPLILSGGLDKLIPPGRRAELAMAAAQEGYQKATGNMSGWEKAAGKAEEFAGFLLPGGPLMGAGKSLALKGATALMGKLGPVAATVIGGAGAGAGLGTYKAVQGLPTHYQQMVDKIRAEKGDEAADVAEGKLKALDFAMAIPTGVLMETLGAAAKPLERAIAGPVTKGINVLGEGMEQIGKVGVGNLAREKAAQFVGGAAQGVGLDLGQQAVEPLEAEAVKQITGERPELRGSVLRAFAGLGDPTLTGQQKVDLFLKAGGEALTEGAVFGAYGALQAVKPRLQTVEQVKGFRAVEQVITPQARAAARRDPDLQPMANELFPSPPEMADVPIEVKPPPAMRMAEPGEKLVGPEQPISELDKEPIPLPGPVKQKATAPEVVPQEPSPKEPIRATAEPTVAEEPQLPKALSDTERIKVHGQIVEPGTKFRMRDVFGGRELEVVSGNMSFKTIGKEKKPQWAGGIKVKEGEREMVVIPQMLDLVDTQSIVKPSKAEVKPSEPSAPVEVPTAGVVQPTVGGVPGQAPTQPRSVVERAKPASRKLKARPEQLEHPFDIVTNEGKRLPVEIKRAEVDPSQFIASVETPTGTRSVGGTLTDIHDKLTGLSKEMGWKSIEAVSPVGRAAIEVKQEAAAYEAEQKAAAELQGQTQLRKLQKQKDDAARTREERGRKVAEEMARRGGMPSQKATDISKLSQEIESVGREMSTHGATSELKERLSSAIEEFRSIPKDVWTKARETPEGRTLSEQLRQFARGIPIRGGRTYIPPDFGPSEVGGGTIPGLGPVGRKLVEVWLKSPEPSTRELRQEMTFRMWKGPQGVVGSLLRPFTKIARKWLADEALREGPEIAWIKREMIYNEAAALATAADLAYGESGFMRGIKPDSDADVAAFMAVELSGTPEGKEFRDTLANEVGEKRADEVIAGIQDFHRRVRRVILRYHPETKRLQEEIKDISKGLAKAEAKFEAAPEKVNPHWRAFRQAKIEEWRKRLDETKTALQKHLAEWGQDWRTYMHRVWEKAKDVNPKVRDAAERAFKRKATPGSVGFRALKHRTGAEGYVPSLHVSMANYIPGFVRWMFGSIATRKLKEFHDGHKTSLRPYKDSKTGATIDPMDFVRPRDQLFYGPDAVEVVSKAADGLTIRPIGTAPTERGGHFPEIALTIDEARKQLTKLGGGLAQAAFEGAKGFEEKEWEHQLNLFLNRYPSLRSLGDQALQKLNSLGNVPFYMLAAYHPLRSLADYTIALPWMIGEVGAADFPRYTGRALWAMAYGALKRAMGEEAAVKYLGKKARTDWTVMRQTGMVHGVSARDFRSDSSALNMPFDQLSVLRKIPRAAHNILIATWNNKEALMHGSMALAVWDRNRHLPREERMGHAREAIEKASGAWATALAPGVIQNPYLRLFTKLWGWAIRQPSYFARDWKEAKARDRMEGKEWYSKFQPGNHNWNRVMRKVIGVAAISYLASKLFNTDVASQYGVRVKSLPVIGPWLRDLEIETGSNLNWLLIPGIPERLFDPTQSITTRIGEGFAKIVGLEQATEQQVESTLRTLGKMAFTSLPYEIQEYYRAQTDPETGQFIIRHPADRSEAFFPWSNLTGSEKKRIESKLGDWLSLLKPGTPLDTMLRMEGRDQVRKEHAETADLARQRNEAMVQKWNAKTPEEEAKWQAEYERLVEKTGKPSDWGELQALRKQFQVPDDARFMFSGASADERGQYLVDTYLRMSTARPELVERARAGILSSKSLTMPMRVRVVEKTEAWLEKRAVPK